MRSHTFLLGLVLASSIATSFAVNPVLGEIEIIPASNVESDAGVWIDGQYVGYAKTLRGSGRLVLLPGEHEVRFQLIGYENVVSTIVVEPGARKQYRLTMLEKPDLTYPDRSETAQLRIFVQPEDAAIFVDDVFVGHVDRFNNRRGVRLKEGTYRLTIALPGYHPFETEMSLVAGQTYEIKTDLKKGDLDVQGGPLSTQTTSDSRL